MRHQRLIVIVTPSIFLLGIVSVAALNDDRQPTAEPSSPPPAAKPERFTLERYSHDVQILTDTHTGKQYLSRYRYTLTEITK